MVVCKNGNSFGTIGGGMVEFEVIKAGTEVASGGAAKRLEFHLTRDFAMCCGGRMEFYIEPVQPIVKTLEKARHLLSERRGCVIITNLNSSTKVASHNAIAPVQRVSLEGEIFTECMPPAERLVIFGGGHVAQALGPIAAKNFFKIILCDEHLSQEPTPEWATLVIPSFEVEEIEATIGPLGLGDYVCIVTRDHGIDQRILDTLFDNEKITYLGMIGSLGKVGRFRKRIEAKRDIPEERWQALCAPIGYSIGAETPDEIAISICAELIARRRGVK